MKKRIGLVTSLMTLLPSLFSNGVLKAQQEEVPEFSGDLGPTLLQLLGALILIVVFIYASVWLMKRYTTGKANSGGNVVTIVERKHLAPKQALYVLKVGEQHLLLGATENGINKICEVKLTDTESAGKQPNKSQESRFSQMLNQARSSLMPLISTKQKEVEA